MKRAHDLSLTYVNKYLASCIECLNDKIKTNEMKIKKYIICGIAGLAFSACTDLDLAPLSEPATGNWFSDQTQVEMSLNTLYLHQFWPVVKDDWDATIMSLDEPTDDWTNRQTVVPMINGTLTGDNSNFVKNTWSFTYKAISRANTILKNISRSKDNLSDELYTRYIADARFVRACQYSRLIEQFGDAIYYTSDIDLDSAYSVSRTPKEQILQHVYEDFDYAIQHLPVAYESGAIQRATKGAAYGMKARVALFFKDYEIARDAASECMKLNAYQLYPDFGELFLSKTKNSSETIFGIPHSTEYGTPLDLGAVTAYLGRNITSPSATATPSLDLFCSFLCTDGQTIDKSPLYDRQNPFKNRDPRCAYTIVEFNSRYFDYNYTCHPDSAKCWNYALGQLVTNCDSKGSGTPGKYASYNGLYLRKGIDSDWSDNLQADNDKIILRYADVLLMYAEAKIELGEIDQTVLDAMNKVRARAYKVDYTSNNYPKITETDQAKLRRLLRIERRMEFAFEGLRYRDIIRWKIAEIVCNRANYGIPNGAADCKKNVKDGLWFFPGVPTIDENGCPDFSKMPNIERLSKLSQRTFDKDRDYLLPIPTSEILLNPGLTQNPKF